MTSCFSHTIRNEDGYEFILKDDKFTTLGYGDTEREAEDMAYEAMINIKNSLVTYVAFSDDLGPLQSKYKRVKKVELSHLQIALDEIEGDWMLHIDLNSNEFSFSQCICDTLSVRISTELNNNSARYMDWSHGPICQAQENYLLRRVREIVEGPKFSK